MPIVGGKLRSRSSTPLSLLAAVSSSGLGFAALLCGLCLGNSTQRVKEAIRLLLTHKANGTQNQTQIKAKSR